MPPRARHTPDQILDAAFELVREDGIDGLSARTLAARLGCSTAPLFTHFGGMEEISERLTDRIMAAFVDRATRDASVDEDPVVMASAGWLAFAAEEPRLYEALFLRPHPWHPKWGAIRRELARRMGEHPAYAGVDEGARFALVGRASVVLHGLGLELWSGRLQARTAVEREHMVEQLVVPVVSAALAHGWRTDFHSRTHPPLHTRSP